MSFIAIFLIFILSIFSAPIVKVAPIQGEVNTELQEFAPSITSDGKNLYFYSKRNQSKYTDLYKSTLVNGKWSTPIELKTLNSPYDDQSPYIDENEKFIVFSSNRDGSIEFKLPNGKIGVSRDLYYSELHNGKWSKPSSLSDKINTEEMEENPFLHDSDLYFTRYPFGNPSEAKIYRAKIIANHLEEAEALPSPINEEGSSNIAAVISKDGKYIYFSSNRPGGYGGYDIYRAEINKDGSYSNVENLGPEINTKGDEAYMVIHKESNTLYFCRKNINENYDIYTALILKDEEKPIRDKPLEETDTSISKMKDKIKETLKDKKKITLDTVRFNTNSADLLPESLPILNSIQEYLKENPNLRIKITGHTDLTGDISLNKILSLERAESVKFYFNQKGIDKQRMITEGKGSTEPLSPNTDIESNRMNRRTEFEILIN
jgi:outer membrane protein OmpA-like peptidoglycan-associated protein